MPLPNRIGHEHDVVWLIVTNSKLRREITIFNRSLEVGGKTLCRSVVAEGDAAITRQIALPQSAFE